MSDTVNPFVEEDLDGSNSTISPPSLNMHSDEEEEEFTPVKSKKKKKKNEKTKPKIGGLDEDGNPWTGGSPTSIFWNKSIRTSPASLLCMRLSGKDGVRMYSDRIKGNEIKFKPNDSTGINLASFSGDVNLKLINHGMDSIFHIPDQEGNMINIITDHARFTLKNVIEHINEGKKQETYDEFDRSNLTDSMMYLLNSIDTSLKQEINSFINSETSGPELWMRIVTSVQSSTIERMTKLQRLIRETKVKDYRGENIKEYAKKMMSYCRDLEAAGKLPEDICYIIIEQLIVTNNKRFESDMLFIRRMVIEETRQYWGRNQDIIKLIQLDKGYFTYQSLLEKAIDSYQTLMDTNQWGMAIEKKDKLTPEVNALIQKVKSHVIKDFSKKGNNDSGNENKWKNKGSFKRNNYPKKNGNNNNGCYECGNPNHIRANCPKIKNNGNVQEKWKITPPKSGEPHSKEVGGKTWNCCSKCRGNKGRWSSTHGTNEHRNVPVISSTDQNTNNTIEANVFVVSNGLTGPWDTPSANTCEVSNEPTSYDHIFWGMMFAYWFILLPLQLDHRIHYWMFGIFCMWEYWWGVILVMMLWFEREIKWSGLPQIPRFWSRRPHARHRHNNHRNHTRNRNKHPKYMYPHRHNQDRKQNNRPRRNTEYRPPGNMYMSPKSWQLSTGIIIHMASLLLLAMFY